MIRAGKINLSVIIPTYKNKELLFKNLTKNLNFLKDSEIIIVNDNPRETLKKSLYSLFGRAKNVKKIILLENKKNLGFGESINQGVKKSSGRYLMLLNDDVELINENFKNVLNYFAKDKKLFAVGFAQREKNNRLVGKNRIYWKRGMFYHDEVKNLTFGLNAWAEGGACIIDKKKFLTLSGFNPLYSPFYWEDIDLSYRAYKRGWRVIFDPNIVVDHKHQSTIGKYFKKSTIKIIAFRNQFIFIWKNITNRDLLMSHFFFLPYNLVYFLLKGKKEFLIGFLKAIKYLREIRRARRFEEEKIKITDKEILKKFNKI